VLALVVEERPQTGWGLGMERRPVEQIGVQVVCSMMLVTFDVVEVAQLSWAELQ